MTDRLGRLVDLRRCVHRFSLSWQTRLGVLALLTVLAWPSPSLGQTESWRLPDGALASNRFSKFKFSRFRSRSRHERSSERPAAAPHPGSKRGRKTGKGKNQQAGHGSQEDEAETGAASGLDPNAIVAAANSTSTLSRTSLPQARVALGAALIQRNAHFAAPTGSLPPGTTLPCYCGSGNNTNPFFAGVRLEGEIYPIDLLDLLDSDALEDSFAAGIGLFGDLTYALVHSYISSTKQSTSSIIDLRLGGLFRMALWDDEEAASLALRLGYALLSFPLKGSAFPGLRYSAPLFGLQLHVPLGNRRLSLITSADVQWLRSNTTVSALGQSHGGIGFEVDMGLRYLYEAFEFSFLYRYQQYRSHYTETPVHLSNGNVEATSLGLTDALSRFVLSAGYEI